jgi:integrase
MARQTNRLSARTVTTLRKQGRHADGGGLYLVIDASGAKRWAFLFRQRGRLREMGLGGVGSVPLATAREQAAEARTVLAAGGDPIEARNRSKAVPTFGAMADSLIASMSPGWRNEKHRRQWKMTLDEYAKPLRPLPVDQIGTEDVLRVLRPLWTEKPETASRLRGRIERVLDAAKALGHRSGENPAIWRGHLKNLLPKRQKLTRGHHAAMAYADLPAFMGALRERPATAARAMEFTILTAARSGETFGATWGEIDLEAKVWTVPANRMKGGKKHRVPLAPRAVAILEELAALRTAADHASPYVFPGMRPGRPLSSAAMDMLLRRMKVAETVHGFRSTFRDWAGEATATPREVAEAALAHATGDETELAYRRGDALEKRRKLMLAWDRYLAAPAAIAKVVTLSALRTPR